MTHHIFKYLKFNFIILILLVAAEGVKAFDTKTGILCNKFKTLKVSKTGDFMGIPAIRMNTDDKIIISFDEIGDQYSELQYKIIHCNADWTPSRLTESEYITGFNITDIDDFAYSENTFIHFVNYHIELPNEHNQILHSGNYLIQIFPRDTPEEIVLQARFMVSENNSKTDGTISGKTDMGFNQEWQQLEFAIDSSNYPNSNPFQDFTITIMQNIDENSIRSIHTPLRIEKPWIIYAHKPELIFSAGNEYRRFESTSNNFPGINVDSLKFIGNNYHVWLKPDNTRANHDYNFDRTQHGRFIIREYNATDSDLGADYITVNFTLELPKQKGTDIYVDGEMTHGVFNENNRMVYNETTGAYQLSMPLKQGAYNYRYLSAPTGIAPQPHKGSALIEGNKSETLNEYTVCVYYHPPGSRADRLIGFQTIYQ